MTAVLLCVGALAFAQAPPVSADAADHPAPPSADAARQGDVAPAAPRDLSRMLLERASVPMSLPAGGLAGPQAGPQPPVAGTIERDRLARLERRGDGWFLLHIVDDAGQADGPPRLVLPNRYLEQIEPLAGQTPPPAMRISGENGVYRGIAVIRLIEPPLMLRHREARGDDAPPPPDQQPAEDDQSGQRLPATPQHLRDALLAEDHGRRMPVPNQPQLTGGDPAGAALSYGRDTFVVDRLIRVVSDADSGWIEARFESDNTLRQPPLRLLPCELLEHAEAIAASPGQRMVRFRVSGMITHYKGQRYLLLRKLLVERNLGQF